MPIDYANYPDNWDEIRQHILDRDNHSCKWCGVENEKWVWYHPSANLPEMMHVKTQDAVQAVKWYGSSEGNIHEAPEHGYLVVLTIAHIHDDNPMNCDENNLAALCQTCHLRHDVRLHANNAKLSKLEYQETVGKQMRLF